MTTQNLLVELFVEELPPKALKKLGEAFAGVFRQGLIDERLVSEHATWEWFASPRRLAVYVKDVAGHQSPKSEYIKLMPVHIGLDSNGKPTSALLKKLHANGINPALFDVNRLTRIADGKNEVLVFQATVDGFSLEQVLGDVLERAIGKLPIPKVMTYQLAENCAFPGWSSVQFVRPAHSLLVLHGDTVLVGVRTSDNNFVLGLRPGNTTEGHRFEASKSPVVIAHADLYAQTLRQDGGVIASFAERRAEIVCQLDAASAKVGGGCRPIEDDALLDEVTALVERPNVLICEFEKEFLDVPQECLILTMKANQKYFPLLDAAGKLTNKFLVVSNISPDDASLVIGGNERVVRPRLADAKFFFDQDRRKTLASRVEGLGKVVYHNQLGTQGERVERVRAIAKAIAQSLAVNKVSNAKWFEHIDHAARLAKTDLLTDMVGEFPELQGVMGSYYALNDGLGETVANAIEDHYKPRFAGDALPRSLEGVVVALADKLETLVGMFGIGNLPTGDKDPFALRRHALGVIRMLVEQDLALDVETLIQIGFNSFFMLNGDPSSTLNQPAMFAPFKDKVMERSASLTDFIFDRLAGSLREQGYSAQEVDAVLALRPQRIAEIPRRLAAVRAFAALPEAPALAAANKRISNILKKADGAVEAKFSDALLQEAAEKALADALKTVAPTADLAWATGNYTANLQALAALKAPVDAFFESVMVNAEDSKLKANRLGLLATLHAAMNRVADLSKLAS